ncbi:MAG: hypothetical protein AAGA30_00330 [Planctomycetota bacterium]
MYARITIQSGISAGTSHLIDGRVIRVGSDPQSDICLPTSGIPEHALTLEFQDESCRVYNRCRETIYVGARTVEPDTVAQWPETDILQMGTDTELLLDFDTETQFDHSEFDNDDSTEIQNSKPFVDHQEPHEAESTRSNNTKTVFQLIVIATCVAGCIALLIRDQNREQSLNSKLRFSEVVSSALTAGDISPVLIQRLQYAEAQRIRGRMEVARNEFRSIRDDLSATNLAHSTDKNESYSRILQFIKSRVN